MWVEALSKLEGPKGSVAKEIEIVAKKIALPGIDKEAPEKLCEQLDVLAAFGVHWQVEIGTPVEDFVGLCVA